MVEFQEISSEDFSVLSFLTKRESEVQWLAVYRTRRQKFFFVYKEKYEREYWW